MLDGKIEEVVAAIKNTFRQFRKVYLNLYDIPITALKITTYPICSCVDKTKSDILSNANPAEAEVQLNEPTMCVMVVSLSAASHKKRTAN
nr:unnamed protein product [Callosobruchus analis]